MEARLGSTVKSVSKRKQEAAEIEVLAVMKTSQITKQNPDNVNVNWSATFKTTPQNRTKESNDSTPGRHALARNGTRAHTHKKKNHISQKE